MKKFKKIFLIPAVIGLMFSLTACGSKPKTPPPESTEQEEVEYDENGNLIPKEDDTDKRILDADSELMITGLFATMEDGNITTNGYWLTESEVGSIADRYHSDYTYSTGHLKKSEVKYVAVFYDINGNRLSCMYFNDKMDMSYNNEYLISDPVMRGIFTEFKDNLSDTDELTVNKDNSNNTYYDETNTKPVDTSQNENNTISISAKTFEDAGFDNEAAYTLAQSTFNIGIPVVVTAKIEANTVLFTDTNGIEYTLSINDGAIVSVWNNTDSVYVWQAE